MKVSVITISDRAFKGEYQDLSGPAIIEVIKKHYPAADIKSEIIPDEKSKIFNTLISNLRSNFIITTGGTGIGPRDVTPEVTWQFCDKELPGIAELLRTESYKETKNAVLSRGYAGIKEKTIVVNFPGSEKGARFCAEIFAPIMKHAADMIEGKGH